MTIESKEFNNRPILLAASQIWAKSQPKSAERNVVAEAEGDSNIEASLEDMQRLRDQFKKK